MRINNLIRNEHILDDEETTDINAVKFPDDIEGIDSENVTQYLSRNTLTAVTKIELGVQSQLLANPGGTVQIYFEVTNLRDQATYHSFYVTDEQRFLRSMNPQVMWVGGGQVVTVIVTLVVPSNTEIGVKDKITFSSQSIAGVTSQAAQLSVISTGAQTDTQPPVLYWNYGSRCEWNTSPGKCAGSIWSVEITTQDLDSGVLRVVSNPRGVLIRNTYTAGTTNEVKATYSSSCCSTRVTIQTFDVAGNQRSVTLDVTEYYLNEAGIAAVVMGVLLLILIIAVMIALIVWCCRKRKESRDLPVYRGRSDERERVRQRS